MKFIKTNTDTIVYDTGSYIKDETLPYGFYYSENENCTMTGYFSEAYILKQQQEGVGGHGNFFPLNSFQDGDTVYFIVQNDYWHSDSITIGYGPDYTLEAGQKHFGSCNFSKLKINQEK